MRFHNIKMLAFLVTMILASATAFADLTSYIDEHNRFILNGEPFFPLGLYVVHCTNGSYSAQLDEIANSPFDTLMNYAVNQCGTDATDVQILSYLDQLESRNLKLIFYLAQYFDGGQNDIDTITHKVNTFKAHPAVISWYLNDERDLTYLAQLEERYEKIRELDENHPVWSVHWNTSWLIPEAHTTDIAGMDSYPIAHLPITEVSRVADAAAQTGKLFWIVPQIFNWQDYPGDPRAATGRPPTRQEMRAMSYLAINHGAKGLIYYSYFNIRDDADYSTRWPQIKAIASEIDELRPVLLSIDQTNENDVICDNADIDFKLMRENKTYYLFAVNTKEATISEASFYINTVLQPESVDVLFEGGRQTRLHDGSFEDNFDAYEVHVYYWQGSPDKASTICSTLGDNSPAHISDQDIFKFSGERGEGTTIRLEIDRNGNAEGKYATLILRPSRANIMWLSDWGAWRQEPTDRSPLPIERTITLPRAGEYEIWVVEQGGWGAWPSERFVGDYCLTLESSGDAWTTLQPARSVE